MTAFPSADHQRMYYLYRYLFTCLATTRKKDGSLNYKAISERLSDRNDFRKIVSELLKSTGELGDPPTIRWGTLHPPTTGEVVTMLTHLKQSLDTAYKGHDPKIPYTRILTQDDVLLVLYKLIELTPIEREQLGVTSSDNLTLLQRALLALQHSGGINNLKLYFVYIVLPWGWMI